MSRRGFGRENVGNVGNVGTSIVENVAGQLGAIFTLRQQAKFMTGARTILRINDEVIGFAFSVSWNISTDGVEIYTIDDALPWEIAPRRISVSGSLGLFQIPGQSPQAKLIQSDVASFLMNRYISIEVKDSATDTIIFKAPKVQITGQQSSLGTEQVGQTMLQWKAVGWQVEVPPAPIDDTKMEKAPTNNPTDIVGQIASKFGI